jgi:hypothetical protein
MDLETAKKNLINPSKVGPGKWEIIHSKAADAITEELKEYFVKEMEYIRINFRCGICRNHITEYIKNNPIQEYWDVIDVEGRPIGLLEWSWKFHNAVNRRLQKQELSWSDCVTIWIKSRNNSQSTYCGIKNKVIEEKPKIIANQDININSLGGRVHINGPHQIPVDQLYFNNVNNNNMKIRRCTHDMTI